MNIRTIVVAFLLATLPLLAEAQTAPTAPESPPPAKVVKKKKKAPAPTTAPATAATPAAAPASAPAATVAAPAAPPGPVAAAPTTPAASPPLPAPTGPIGSVVLVTGSVKVGERSLGNGDPISEGETVVVGPNSYANLKFNDGGRVLLRPNTEFAVESFRTRAPLPAATDKAPEQAAAVEGSAIFRLVRGGFRAISGLIGHREQQTYGVKTPAATIGIRGTDYEVVTCADDCPSQAQAISGATQVASTELAGLQLAAANGGGGGAGIIVATNEGAITLQTGSGETVVDAGKVALSMGSGPVVMLPKVPDLLLLTPTPSPKACE